MNAKNMRIAIGILMASAVVVIIVIIFIVIGKGFNSSSDGSSFPFFVFFPSWIAIFIPIITQKRREQKELMEEDLDYE